MYLTYDSRSKDIKINSQIKLAIFTNLDIFSFFTFTNTLHLKKHLNFSHMKTVWQQICVKIWVFNFHYFIHKIVFLVSFRYRPFMEIEVVLGTVVLNTGVIQQNMHILIVPLLVYG